jgi:hypothetical protein
MYNQYTFSYILSLIDMTLVSRQMSLICLKAQYYNKPSDMEKVKVTTIINIRMVIYITMYTIRCLSEHFNRRRRSLIDTDDLVVV